METPLEHILTSTNKAHMISYLDAHPEDFGEAIELAVSDKQPYSWRAAWLLWSCINENDQHIKPYVNTIIKTLSTKNDDYRRELLKILLPIKLNVEHEGFLFNFCMKIWEKINKKPSVRYTAFKFIVKIMRKHPELTHEITFLTQSQYLETMSYATKKSLSEMTKIFNPQFS